MRLFPYPLLAFVILLSCQPEPNKDKPDQITEIPKQALPGYDSLLAKNLGADEYGMKAYVMAFLKAGPNRGQDSTEAAKIQQAHLKNIQRMAKEGKLVLAGPFMDDGEVRGIYIFNVETIEEAKELTETDPAIEAGRLVMELHPWYGPAALQQLDELNEKVARTKF